MSLRLLLVLVLAWSQVLQGAMVVCQEADGATNFEFAGRACDLSRVGDEGAVSAALLVDRPAPSADDCDLCRDAPLTVQAERPGRGVFVPSPTATDSGAVAPAPEAAPQLLHACAPSAPAAPCDAAQAPVGVVRLRC